MKPVTYDDGRMGKLVDGRVVELDVHHITGSYMIADGGYSMLGA